MPARPADDPILLRFRSTLDHVYGDRIERVILFGSRARGDAREDSDDDVAVFLKDLGRFWDEVEMLFSLTVNSMRVIPISKAASTARRIRLRPMPLPRNSGNSPMPKVPQ